MSITPETYTALGLSDQEYQRILDILGREPTTTELAMFSVEWSEHCGYMCSRPLLKLLPKTGKYGTAVGEDSGAFFIDDMAIVFKMESHNHPSQIEPFQGAATGVGGILRDIFTAGARPIASLNSLRFGPLESDYNRYLVHEVVRGISFYGNCVGVPTVGGEIYFDKSYEGNCLVNAMTIGICDKKDLAKARAGGVGNTIMYVGGTTGRDGIGGCSVLASHNFTQEEAKRPTVQVGDPLTEKCLIEATLEILKTGHVVGIKDMGAAGLTCSISEMAAAGNVGIFANLDHVPLREEGMEAWEIMMSESQERMLVCVEKGYEHVIRDILLKWELNAASIGHVTDDGMVRIEYKDELVANVDAIKLTDPPTYDLPAKNPYEGRDASVFFDIHKHTDEEDQSHNLLKILADPSITSKRWVYEQYDHMVQTNTVARPGKSDAAVVRIKETDYSIAATVDCNSSSCRLNPRGGVTRTIVEAAQNLFCSGAEPAAVTDCLNFGDPKKPEVFWYFKECVEQIGIICEELNLPVISGNVSFYNESQDGPVNPTPTIGMVGVIKDSYPMTQNFKHKNDIIVLIKPKITINAGNGEYLRILYGEEDHILPPVKLEDHIKVQKVMLEIIKKGLIHSAHDCSEGGLSVAIAECCISGDEHIGAVINLSSMLMRRDMAMFNEALSNIVISCRGDSYYDIGSICAKNHLSADIIGTTGGNSLIINHRDKRIVDLTLTQVHDAWANSLEKRI